MLRISKLGKRLVLALGIYWVLGRLGLMALNDERLQDLAVEGLSFLRGGAGRG